MIVDAIVLAGGAGRRLGGVDKAALRVAGKPLLDRVVAACGEARDVVVVGAERPTMRPVQWTLEEPPGGGPLAGLAAGVARLRLDSEQVVVLATDLPYVTAADVDRLLSAIADADAVVFVDASDRAQPLCAAYDVRALRAAIAATGEVHGAPVSRILDNLRVRTIPDHGAARDADTQEELDMAETHLTLDEWVRLLATELDVDPADVDVKEILDVAREAAHNIARPAAPLTTFIAGYAAGLRGGADHTAAALQTARALTAERAVPEA